MKNKKFKFVVPNDKRESHYIGFDLDEDNSFVFPCQYFVEDVSDLEKKKEAKNIITLLKKVQKDYLYGGNDSEFVQFYSMIWLIKDFIENGYYVETETVSKIGSNGKINWKKTIKNKSFFMGSDSLVFKDFVRNKNIANDTINLVQIYKCCLNYSVGKIGFIFGIENTERSIFNIEVDREYMTSVLMHELGMTFRDYKRDLINQLLSIINNQNSKSKGKSLSIYDSEFEYVFEFLVNQVFGTEKVKDFYNTYSYVLKGQNPIPASKLRPDTIMKDVKNKVYYVIDSKYYNYGYTGEYSDLPQSSSISKQIGYSHFLRNKLKEKGVVDYTVKSIFVLPFASSEPGKYIESIGYAKMDGNDDPLDEILVLLVDLKKLINAYINKDRSLNPETIINIINN